MTMCDAAARFVPHGSCVVMGAALEALIPFAAEPEIIRRQVLPAPSIPPESVFHDFHPSFNRCFREQRLR